MTILRLSLFVFLTGGYTAFFRNRLKMNRRLTWVFTFSAITLILYVASLLNILLGAVYGICGLGAILSMYQIWRYMTKKDSIRGLDFTALAMLLYLLLFGAVLLQSPLLHFDNFTHWGSIHKGLPPIFSLTYLRNYGAAFSILQNQQWFFVILTIVVVGAAIYYFIRNLNGSFWFLLSLSLIISGGLGNFIDRVRLGYVVDMVHLDFMDFAIFNVADSYLTVGVVMLFIVLWREGEDGINH